MTKILFVLNNIAQSMSINISIAQSMTMSTIPIVRKVANEIIDKLTGTESVFPNRVLWKLLNLGVMLTLKMFLKAKKIYY